jgi:XTP/dITP diphosphohydrolase
MEKKLKAFGRLLGIMDDLREKCPWDRKQTMESLRYLTIEETYELSDAIIEKDLRGVKEELGDIMLHMVFYSRIAEEKEAFNVADVMNEVCEKLIKRHPHIYGDVVVEGEEDVKRNWEQIKLKEGKRSVLEGVPNSLPAMVKAYRVQQKVKQVGFEWEETQGALDKIEEEMTELREAFALNDGKALEKEIGDILFSIINFARYLDIDAEHALELTNKKFIARFKWMEKHAAGHQRALQDMTLEEMDMLWNEAKESLGN